MRKIKSFVILFLLLNVYVHVAGQVLPDSIRIKYETAHKASEKGRILYSYLEPLQDDPSFLTSAAALNKYFEGMQDETGKEYVQLVANYQLARTGDYTMALKILFQQLEEFKSKKDDYGVLIATKIISVVYNFVKDLDNTILYDKKAIDLAVIIGDKTAIATSFNNLASDYAENNLPDSGLRYAENAVKFARELNNPRILSTTLGTLAENYIGIKQYNKAISLLRESLVYALYSNKLIVVWNYNDCAQIYFETNKQDSTRFYAYKAAALAKEKGYHDQLLRAYQYLYASFEKTDMKDSAFIYLKAATNTKDTFFSLQNSKQVQAINFREQSRQQEAEKIKIRYQNKLRTYALMAGLGVLFIIAFILVKNNRQKHKANNILKQTLADLKSTQAQLIQSEKMASLGELTAGIAHEIQNPLNFVNNFSEVSNELIAEMVDEVKKGNGIEAEKIANDIKQNLEKIHHHGKRADAILKGMLQHSRTSSGQKEPTDINALCDEYLRVTYQGLMAKNKSFSAKIRTEFDEKIEKINIVPEDIGRVLRNLYNNAFYAVNEKKKIHPNNYDPVVTVMTRKIGDKVEVRVIDNGNGIPQNIVDKIFQPFFTTKPTGQGIGLGLSLSYDIVKVHGGEIKVESKEGEFSQFTIALPI